MSRKTAFGQQDAQQFRFQLNHNLTIPIELERIPSMAFQFFQQGEIHLIESFQVIDHDIPHLVDILHIGHEPDVAHVTQLCDFHVKFYDVDPLLFDHE